MTKRWVLFGLAVAVGLGFASAKSEAGLVDATTSFGEATTWDGFGEDFAAEWEGETTVVEDLTVQWSSQGTGTSGTTNFDATILAANWISGAANWMSGDFNSPKLIPGHWETRKTVRQISSSCDSAALSSSWLRYDGREFTAEKNDYDGAEMARYATLESSDGTLLANASAIACKSTNFGDDGFSADGRVSAFSIIINTAEESPATLTVHSPLEAPAQIDPEADLSQSLDTGDVDVSADATGRSWFDVSYELDQETAFSLQLDIARLGEAEVTFSATNIETGEVAFSFETVETGTQQEISMDGILEAGKYKFALNCLTDSSVDSSGGLNTGGQAMFDLALDLEEEYVQVWVPEHYERSSGFVLGDFSAASSSVPEPSMLGLLILGGFVCLFGHRRR